MDTQEERLIPEIISGNEVAFNELYNLYATRAYRTALLICGNSHLAEDVAQETFIICLRKLGNLKSPKAFPAYFYRILTRTAWKLSKGNKEVLPLEESLQLAAPEKMPEDYTQLYRAVEGLKPKLRTTIILYYFNEMSMKEIAHIMGVPEGTVKSRLHTAKKQLAKELKKEDYYG